LNQQPSCPTPPYRIDAYTTALTGGPRKYPHRIAFKHLVLIQNPYGQPVTALEAGRYTITVTDQSKLRSFAFAAKSTTLPFRGTISWTLTLRSSFYRYRVLGRKQRSGSVTVLASS
jgi:hypothetical protein